MNMRFAPYERLDSSPNVIVDGAAGTGTVLTLSHWPKSGTPAGLKRDTSAEIVFAYLDSPAFHVKLRLEGTSTTSFPPATIQERLERHLATGHPAWNPYD